MNGLPQRVGGILATSAGRALAGLFFLFAKARSGLKKALHAKGQLLQGVVRRNGSAASTGVAWLDEAGTDRVTVRLSRSVGLPRFLPDILGLAVRVPVGGDGYGDLLMATTGTGPITRFVLRPTRNADDAVYSTLFPYRTPTGPILLAAFARARSPRTFELAWARSRGVWRPFSTLEIIEPVTAFDATVSFDPVVNVVPGLEPYAWSQELRKFSYAASRNARHDGPQTDHA